VNVLDMGEGVDLGTERFLDGICPLEERRTWRRSSYVVCVSRGDCANMEYALGDAGEVGKNEVKVQDISNDRM